MNVITAYFTNPQGICSGSRPASEYIGDQLLLQTGDDSSKTRAIPFKQEDLESTKWVEGGCFLGMGKMQAIKKDMSTQEVGLNDFSFSVQFNCFRSVSAISSSLVADVHSLVNLHQWCAFVILSFKA